MSNRDNHDTGRGNTDPPGHKTWQQRYGATLLLMGFALLIILMGVMQKKLMQ